MQKLLRLIILIFILQSCVTSKSALKNFNNDIGVNSLADLMEELI